MKSPLRVIFDTNAYDEVVARPGLLNRIQELASLEKLRIVHTHVQEDQIARIRYPAKRANLEQAHGVKVPTSGAVWDVSRWGDSTWGSGTGEVQLGDVMTSDGNHAEDALIASTASVQADILVTGDKRLRKRIQAKTPRLAVVTVDEFVARIASL